MMRRYISGAPGFAGGGGLRRADGERKTAERAGKLSVTRGAAPPNGTNFFIPAWVCFRAKEAYRVSFDYEISAMEPRRAVLRPVSAGRWKRECGLARLAGKAWRDWARHDGPCHAGRREFYP